MKILNSLFKNLLTKKTFMKKLLFTGAFCFFALSIQTFAQQPAANQDLHEWRAERRLQSAQEQLQEQQQKLQYHQSLLSDPAYQGQDHQQKISATILLIEARIVVLQEKLDALND